MSITVTGDKTAVWDSMSAEEFADYTSDMSAFTDEDGYFSIFADYDYSNVDENGFYFDIRPIFNMMPVESWIGTFLEKLSGEEMTIISQTVPYTYEGYDTANPNFNLISIGYNGLTDPIITIGGDDVWEGSGYGDTEITFEEPVIGYGVEYDNAETTGLRSRFGYELGSSIEDQIASGVATIASEVYNSYMSKRRSFKRTPRIQLLPAEFGYLEAINVIFTQTTEDTTEDTTGPTTGY